jgi:pimeloyl-ACP methyl ester carboxylesterase
MYPSAVSGLVLVDPVPEDFYARAAGVVPDRYTVEEETYLKELYADSTRLAEQREGAAYPSSMEQARASDQKHRTPTTLLIAAGGESRSQADPLWRLWVNELRSWADRRPSVHTVVVEDSGHHISRERPQVVIQAIRDMTDTARRIPVR